MSVIYFHMYTFYTVSEYTDPKMSHNNIIKTPNELYKIVLEQF